MQSDFYDFETTEVRVRGGGRRRLSGLAGSAVAIVFLSAVGAQMLATAPPSDVLRADKPAPLAPRFALRPYSELLDANYSLGSVPAKFSTDPLPTASLRPATTLAAAQMTDLRGRATDVGAPLAQQADAPMPTPRPLDLALAAPEPASPLPPQRPSDLTPPQRPAPLATATADTAREPRASVAQAARAPRGGRTVVARAEQPKEQGFFEKLFGGGGNSGQAMAYAPEGGLLGGSSRLTGVAPSEGASNAVSDRFTAVYDISAKTVYLPDGTRLEAHSGLGDLMDNPRYAHVRMRGVTPPAVYDLREREALFHGVRAIRLTPINSSVHGRAGLLAHTYMLGPSGQSNGCVSFRDYQRFLNAFLSGQVKRLKVVASL